MTLLPRLATISLLLATSCLLNVYASDMGNINKVNGSAEVASAQHYADISLVNGKITMASNSSAKAITTVNGSINLEDNVQLQSASTVNGKIVAGTGLKVTKELTTVNGKINLGANADIAGDVSTVNGAISIIDSIIAGDISSLNGDISLKGNTVIKGDVIYKAKNKSKSWWSGNDDNKPTLYIGKDTVIEGSIILEQPVELQIHNPAMQAKVVDKSQ